MDEKLTPRHLEVLAKLASNSEPVNYKKFLPDLNPVLELIDCSLVNKTGENYELSAIGREYFKIIFKHAERFFERYKF
jgi:predicted transcriptional regulator